MRFSERYGYKPVRKIIQKESIDKELKNSLWSILNHCFWSRKYDNGRLNYYRDSNLRNLINAYWFNLFKVPTDTIPLKIDDAIKQIRSYFFQCEWHIIYSLIEETLDNYPSQYCEKKEKFIEQINHVLEIENSAYRIINNEIIPITSEQEIKSIEEAITNTNQFSGVQQHLNQALKLMSDRQNPDYRNSIKESISAVESICKIVTNEDKATLGKALKIIEDKHGLHAALKGSLSQLYGYTSDADGIRHAMLEESNLSYIDAKFMLVACTNFINYLIDKTKD